jgi:hypothetical protein
MGTMTSGPLHNAVGNFVLEVSEKRTAFLHKTLNMKAVLSFETSGSNYPTIRRNSPNNLLPQ